MLLAGALAACDRGDRLPDAFIGTWQSDETPTLESAQTSTQVTPEDMAEFENDFFGEKVVIFGRHEGATYFANSGETPVFHPNEIVESGENFVVFYIPASAYNEDYTVTWRVDGDLIYAEIEPEDFREYYRRVDGR